MGRTWGTSRKASRGEARLQSNRLPVHLSHNQLRLCHLDSEEDGYDYDFKNMSLLPRRWQDWLKQGLFGANCLFLYFRPVERKHLLMYSPLA